MIICVSRHEAPLRPPPRLRSPRPHAAASDRVPPLLIYTKLHLPLMLPLLIVVLVYPVSFTFSGWYRVPLLRHYPSSTEHEITPRTIGGTTYFPIHLGDARLGYVTLSGVEVFTDH
jgi:hypothetical protein